MKQFAGLCVGGPYAGKQIVEMTGTLKVQERETVRHRTRAFGALPSVRQHVYRSHMIGSVGLWIHESLDLDGALKELAGGYITACNQADPRVAPSFSR